MHPIYSSALILIPVFIALIWWEISRDLIVGVWNRHRGQTEHSWRDIRPESNAELGDVTKRRSRRSELRERHETRTPKKLTPFTRGQPNRGPTIRRPRIG